MFKDFIVEKTKNLQEGYKPLKNEIKKFVKNFLDLDVNEENCLPTVGSMMGSFTSFMTLMHTHKDRKKLLDAIQSAKLIINFIGCKSYLIYKIPAIKIHYLYRMFKTPWFETYY